jgi:GNAT superfamily N-acetyltransferase
MTTVVRRAVPDDRAVLIDLVAEYCRADGHAFDATVARMGVEPLLADDTYGAIWLIDPNESVVPRTADGYIVVTWGWSIEIGGLDVVLDEFYVRSRGDGKGGDALRVIEAECRERGVKRILLETELSNERARQLYERHGYQADTSIWMSKELT